MPLVSGTRGGRLRGTTHVCPCCAGLGRSSAGAPLNGGSLPVERRPLTRAQRPRLLDRDRILFGIRQAVRPAAPEPCSVRRSRRLAPDPARSVRATAARTPGRRADVLPLHHRFHLTLGGPAGTVNDPDHGAAVEAGILTRSE